MPTGVKWTSTKPIRKPFEECPIHLPVPPLLYESGKDRNISHVHPGHWNEDVARFLQVLPLNGLLGGLILLHVTPRHLPAISLGIVHHQEQVINEAHGVDEPHLVSTTTMACSFS